MPKKLFAVLIAFSLLSLSTQDSQAARSITISADKSSLFGNEEAKITIVQSGFTEGETIYIKGAFSQDSTTNYFGYTKNGDNWVKNGESNTSQRQIKIGEWDGILTIKSDFADSGYKGEGDYKFKVGFYYTTSGGNLSSINWSTNNIDFNISEPDPSPSPSPSKPPSSSPSPTKAPSPSSSIVLTSATTKPEASPKFSPEILSATAEGAQKSPQISPNPSSKEAQNSTSRSKLAGLLTGSGLLIIGASAVFLFLYKKTMEPNSKNDKETS